MIIIIIIIIIIMAYLGVKMGVKLAPMRPMRPMGGGRNKKKNKFKNGACGAYKYMGGGRKYLVTAGATGAARGLPGRDFGGVSFGQTNEVVGIVGLALGSNITLVFILVVLTYIIQNDHGN